jgi:hypothetical protein
MALVGDEGGADPAQPKRGKGKRQTSGSHNGRRSRGRASTRRGRQGATSVRATGVKRATPSGAGSRKAAASVWPREEPHAGAEGTPALELAAESGGATGLLGALLELVGTEHLTLEHTLAAGQREQDRLANRTWRRPGGLARPAGL